MRSWSLGALTIPAAGFPGGIVRIQDQPVLGGGISTHTMPVESSGLPDASTLQALELHSRQHGSGLGRDELIGHWLVERVWSKGRLQPSEVAGGALRALTASLGIEPAENGELVLSNSIAIGLLKLCFIGSGHLKQRRPLLIFQFHHLQLSLGGISLFTLALPKPAQGQDPFFALIASDQAGPAGRWLAARGRGGGLALWRQQDADT